MEDGTHLALEFTCPQLKQPAETSSFSSIPGFWEGESDWSGLGDVSSTFQPPLAGNFGAGEGVPDRINIAPKGLTGVWSEEYF